MIAIIAAMTERRVIGAGDRMPWSVPEEYARYLDTVRDQTVIFGRKSYEIFGSDLEGTQMIVVTRSAELDGVRTASDLSEAIALAEQEPGETFVAGGASIYEQAIPLADRMLLSTIHGDFEGDTFFPEFDASAWDLTRRERHPRFDCREYRRR